MSTDNRMPGKELFEKIAEKSGFTRFDKNNIGIYEDPDLRSFHKGYMASEKIRLECRSEDISLIASQSGKENSNQYEAAIEHFNRMFNADLNANEFHKTELREYFLLGFRFRSAHDDAQVAQADQPDAKDPYALILYMDDGSKQVWEYPISTDDQLYSLPNWGVKRAVKVFDRPDTQVGDEVRTVLNELLEWAGKNTAVTAKEFRRDLFGKVAELHKTCQS